MFGDNIRKVMAAKGISSKELANALGITPTHISYILTNRRRPSYDLLEKMASVLGVSVDRLTGDAASCIINARIEEAGTTLAEVAKKANVPLYWLERLDEFVPGRWNDSEVMYAWITRVADVIGIPGSDLRAALARQEEPIAEPSTMSLEDAFDLPASDIVTYATKKVPLLGSIAAGEPILACEEHDAYVEIDRNMPVDFCLRVKGDSMIDARIHDGDLVFVKKQNYVDNGEIAVVMIDDEVTLKRFYQNNGGVILKPENSKYQPKYYPKDELSKIRILGKAVFFQSRL
jgi:repressor LexA